MDPLFSFLPYVICTVVGVVGGIALDHWVKRPGNLISGTVTEAKSIETSFVSEAAHVATVTAVIKAALAAQTVAVAAAAPPVAIVPPKPAAPPPPPAAAPAAVKPAA